MASIRRSIAARKIQKYWVLFKSLALTEIQSDVEDASIAVDYTFRNEKLFDFTQIEIDQIKNNQNESIAENRS